MRLAELDITNVRHGAQSEQVISLSDDPAAVSVIVRTLVHGQYKHKIQAGLREVWANGLDESPTVDVHLPSIVDPRVVIRDYGKGLSHEDMMGRFTKIGASTKRASNEKIGSRGYGRLAPLAYTPQFIVRSFHAGMVRTYVISLESNFIPRVVHYPAQSTDDPSGLEVSWNVHHEDIKEFRRQGQITFFGAKERTNIKNETWSWPTLELVAQGADWRAFYHDGEHTLSGTYVCMGGVLYPIDPEPIGFRWSSENWIGDDVLIIDVPIGSVDIQDSREALGYDQPTIEYLKQRLAKAREAIESHFLAAIDKIDHIVQAALFFSKHRSKLLGRVCKNTRQWRGQDVPLFLQAKGFRVCEIQRYARRRRSWNRSPVKSLAFRDQHEISFELFQKPITIFIDQGERKSDERILAGNWNQNDKALWVKTTDPQATLEYLGKPDHVVYLHDLPEPPKPVRAPREYRKGATIEVLDQWNGRRVRHFDETIEDGWFIDMEGRTPVLGPLFFGTNDATTEFLERLHRAGVAIDRIYAISPSKQKRRIFKNLKRLTFDELRKLIGPVDFAAAKRHQRLLQANRSALLNHHPGLKLPADLELLKEQIEKPSPCPDYDKYELLSLLGLEIPETPSTPVPDLNELINQRFPLAPCLAQADTTHVQQYLDLMMEKKR